MARTSAAQLIARVEPMPYSQRVRELGATARKLSPADADALIAELAAGSRYSRELGLQAARQAGRLAALVSFFDDRDVELRTVAAANAPRFADFTADAAVAFHAAASPRERAALERGVQLARRADLADALIKAELGAHRDSAAANLLSSASSEFAVSLLDRLMPLRRASAQVARRFPMEFLAHARDDLESLPPDARGSWWARRASGVRVALTEGGDADAVFTLVERFAPPLGWGSSQSTLLSALVRRDADRALVALRAAPRSDPHLSRSALRHIVTLATAEGVAYGHDLLSRPEELRRLVLAAAPERRTAYLAAVAATVDRLPLLAGDVDAALPAELRIADARRRLAEDVGAGRRPDSSLVRLPFAEAEPELRKLLASSLADDRGRGYTLLLAAAGYSRDREIVGGLLASFNRLRNEQEPVRGAALVAIANLPVRLFADDQIPQLRQIVTDAYSARDHSSASASAIRKLAARLLTAPNTSEPLRDFALDALTGSNGPFFLPDLEQVPVAIAHRIIARLLPVIDEHEHSDRFDVLFSLAHALGKRGEGMALLDARLRVAAWHRNASIASSAIHAWLQSGRTRAERVRALMGSDPSTVELWPVARVVTTSATDLLTPRVIAGRITGRFHTRRSVWLPPTASSRFWTGEQRRQAAERFATMATTKSIDQWMRHRAIAAVALLPGFGREVLLRAAAASDVTTAEVGLSQLGRYGADDGVDRALVAALSTDRARVAGAAAIRRAGSLRPGEFEAFVAAALASTPPIKITSRKALAAATERAAPGDPWPLLESVLGAKPHPDVITAVVSASLRRLSDPRALPFVVAQLPADPRGARLLQGLDPCAIAAPQRADVARRVADLCDSPDLAVRQGAASTASRWVSFAPELRSAVWKLLADVTDRPTDVFGTGDLVRGILAAGHPDGLRDAVARLLRADAQTPLDREPLARRRLDAMLAALPWDDSASDSPAVRVELATVVDELVVPGDNALAATGLALRLLADASADADPEAIARVSRALGDRPAVALSVVGIRSAGEVPPARLARLVALVPRLRAMGEAEGVLAVAILAVSALRRPLDNVAVAELAALRGSEFAEVRERARRIDGGAHP